jgi:hypothetical protein
MRDPEAGLFRAACLMGLEDLVSKRSDLPRPENAALGEEQEPVTPRIRPCEDTRSNAATLLALRPTKISANDPPSTWWPGER